MRWKKEQLNTLPFHLKDKARKNLSSEVTSKSELLLVYIFIEKLKNIGITETYVKENCSRFKYIAKCLFIRLQKFGYALKRLSLATVYRIQFFLILYLMLFVKCLAYMFSILNTLTVHINNILIWTSMGNGHTWNHKWFPRKTGTSYTMFGQCRTNFLNWWVCSWEEGKIDFKNTQEVAKSSNNIP